MLNTSIIVTILISIFNGILTKSVELTFELPDSAEECFYEDIKIKNTSASLEYQVYFQKFYIYTKIIFVHSSIKCVI